MSKHGIVTSMGWWSGREKKRVFRVIVEFPEGPPNLPLNMVWDRWPVDIIRSEMSLAPQPPQQMESGE